MMNPTTTATGQFQDGEIDEPMASRNADPAQRRSRIAGDPGTGEFLLGPLARHRPGPDIHLEPFCDEQRNSQHVFDDRQRSCSETGLQDHQSGGFRQRPGRCYPDDPVQHGPAHRTAPQDQSNSNQRPDPGLVLDPPQRSVPADGDLSNETGDPAQFGSALGQTHSGHQRSGTVVDGPLFGRRVSVQNDSRTAGVQPGREPRRVSGGSRSDGSAQCC